MSSDNNSACLERFTTGLHRGASSAHTNPKRKRGIFREFFPRLRFGLVFRLRNPCVNRSSVSVKQKGSAQDGFRGGDLNPHARPAGSGAAGCTQPVFRREFTPHGLRTTRGTHRWLFRHHPGIHYEPTKNAPRLLGALMTFCTARSTDRDQATFRDRRRSP